jgi:putative endonuclease
MYSYKGFSEDPAVRLIRHNNGDLEYTSRKLPWLLVYVEELATKALALKHEKRLKSYSHIQVLILPSSQKNIVHLFR